MTVSECIKVMLDSINELKTYRQFSGRNISFPCKLNDQEVKNVLDNIKTLHPDVDVKSISKPNNWTEFQIGGF